MDTKLLLIGWDAADWKIIQRLMDTNLMPHTRKLVETGVMSNLSTLSPVLSPMLWTSIATGKRAHKHGIHGFIEPTRDGKGVQPVTNLSRKCKAVWNILCQNGKRCNVIGWWPSSPVEPINGVMVSNHYQRAPKGSESLTQWPLPLGTIHPERLRETLADLRIHPAEIGAEHLMPFVPDGAKIDQSKDRRLENIVKVIADCSSIQACATHLMETEPWDFMAVYFDAIDHFCHGFMRYHPPKLDWVSESDYQMYKNVVTAGYVFHDMMLGRLVELAGSETTIMLISDHGFHPDHLRLQKVPLEPAGPAAEHREHGIFVLNGPGIKQDQLIHGAGLLDIAPTILHLFGLPVGEDMDGRVVIDAFEREVAVKHVPSWDNVPGMAGQHPPGFALEEAASAQAIDQLVELGYIEKPSQNIERAIEEANVELDYNLARAYMDAGMHGDAVPLLTELYRKRSIEFRFGIQLALCFQALGQVDNLERLVENMKTYWGKATVIATQRLKEFNVLLKERIQSRRDMLESIDQLTDNSSESNLDQDTLLSQAERAAYRRIKSTAAGNPQALDYLAGWVALSKDNLEEALGHFEQARESNTVVPGFYFHLAETFRKLNLYDRANENYLEVLKLDPHNAGAFLGLARLNLSRGENELALEHAKRALGLRHNLPPAHYCTAVVHYRNNKFREAIAAIDIATRFNPNFVEAYDLKAKILRENLDDGANADADAVQRLSDEIRALQKKAATQSSLLNWATVEVDEIEKQLPRLPELVNPRRPCLYEGFDYPDSDSKSAAQEIIVVSGLPRSGTSMMMQMLSAAGIEPMSDGKRPADENNRKGYLEFEKVKSLGQCNDWLGEATGKCIKVVSPLIPFLPHGFKYRVIFMERDVREIIASQHKMIDRLSGKITRLADDELAGQLIGHNKVAENILSRNGIPWIKIAHAEAILQPAKVARMVSDFLGLIDKNQSMQVVIDPSLYRESVNN